MFLTSIAPVDLTGINHNFYGNIQYGSINREIMDIFIPTDPVAPTGICVQIHGGGFFQNSKDSFYNAGGEAYIQDLLSNGYAFAAINYEFINTEVELCGQLSSLKSATVAIQFLKFYADLFNLNKDKFVLKGSSAGAGIAMYLGYQPSLANPLSPNLILREDTTVGAITLNIPQATYDTVKWETEIFASLGYSILLDIQNNPENLIALRRTFGINGYGDLFTPAIIQQRQEMDFLQFITDNGGIPTYISCSVALETELTNYTLNDISHHPYHPQTIKAYLDVQSTENVAYISALGISDPSGETEREFVKRKIDEL